MPLPYTTHAVVLMRPPKGGGFGIELDDVCNNVLLTELHLNPASGHTTLLLPQGTRVKRVVKGSVSARAHLQPDDVIMAVGGKNVSRSHFNVVAKLMREVRSQGALYRAPRRTG